MLLGRSIHEITESDLQNLIGKPEDNNLEFKKILPNPQTGKTEFLADVSAFANAGGGHIIYGMDEDDLKAIELCGLGAINVEKEVQRLENWTKEGIEPRVPGLRIRPVDLSGEATTAIVIHIPHSFAAPHQVKDTRRFHSRYSIGKDAMNVAELRAAFSLSENLENRIKAFRKERADILSSDEVEEEIPVILIPGIRLAMHVIPLSFLDIGQTVDLSVFQSGNNSRWIMEHNLHYGRFNLEGFVLPGGIEREDRSTDRYTQVYRNGVIEAVDTIYEKDQLIYLPIIEKKCLDLLRRSLAIEENLGITTPLVLMISLLGVRNHRFIASRDDLFFTSRSESIPPVSKNKLLIPDIVIENYEQPPTTLMKDVFDMLWNAGGWARSFSYDKNGVWKHS